MINLKDFQTKNIHLVGIGGISMNALAKYLISRGAVVSGSDKSSSPLTDELVETGATVHINHNAENVVGSDLIIRTSAVHDDNAEIIKARQLNIPILERAEAWGQLMLDYKNVICFSGTHGKTTSTSMMTDISVSTDIDATVMVGSVLDSIGGNLRIGKKDYFIAESCEYCNSFLNFNPTIAVWLNIEEDHLDFFDDLEDICSSFKAFALNTPEDTGVLVINGDDKNCMATSKTVNRKIVSFAINNKEADIVAENLVGKNGYYSFDVYAKGEKYITVTLKVPGIHNVYNALSAIACSWILELSKENVVKGIENFTGSQRRFQYLGMYNGATVVDDYAHHPSEMVATLETAKQMGFKRIIVAFQSHTYTRTHALFHEFAKALAMADISLLAEIYSAREVNTVGVSEEALAKEAGNCIYLKTFENIADYTKNILEEGDLLITMGAGETNKVYGLMME